MNSLIIHNQLVKTGLYKSEGKPCYINTSVPFSLKKEFVEYIRANNINSSKLVRTLIVNYLADVKSSFVIKKEKTTNDK
jgi:hypothetical protein